MSGIQFFFFFERNEARFSDRILWFPETLSYKTLDLSTPSDRLLAPHSKFKCRDNQKQKKKIKLPSRSFVQENFCACHGIFFSFTEVMKFLHPRE
jgi:hypothetical protein